MTENQLYCRAQLPQQMIMVLEAMGVNKKKLYEELGRDYDLISPDEMLPCEVGKRLWSVATRYIPEDVISFRIMEYFSMSAFGVAGYVIVNSPTGLKAYENFVRYNTLTSNIITFELRLGQTMDLHMILNKKYEPEDRFEIEMNIIGFINFTRSLTANHILPEAVYMQYDKPADISPYQAMLPNVPFFFNAGENKLVYPKELTTMKLVGANAQLYETFDSMAEEALKAH